MFFMNLIKLFSFSDRPVDQFSYVFWKT